MQKEIKYYTYEELRPIAIEAMRREFLDRYKDRPSKFIGDISKRFDNNLQVGKWLAANGYIKKKKMYNYVHKQYYINVMDYR